MLKRIWKRIKPRKHPSYLLAVFPFILSLGSCLYPVRYAETLENDSGFIYLSSQLYPREIVDSIKNPWEAKSQRGKASLFNDRNNLGILLAKNSLLDDAEIEFTEAHKLAPSDPIPVLNLIRLYYLVEDVSECKTFLSGYLKTVSQINRNKVEKTLEDNHREEELVIYWDVLSNIPGQEVHAWNGLADHFFRKQDWPKSYFYLEKILQLSPYHKNARALMLQMANNLEKWDEAIVFGLSLVRTGERVPDLEYYLAHAYSEKKRYDEALVWIGKVPENERENIRFLDLWKTCLLSKNPKSDLTPLVPYFKKLRAQGLQISQEDFLPTTTPEGKEAADRNIWGR
ncbi:tetratricopeptide repeat protein [Leptospira fainei]|uniref:tetratricopeptide repeat protein n=1 Tax=Leptospira fainei TaxID=48782 RepID=UPI0005871395|nr:tetratricopeptide repeat protein [Leptospira fainei]